MKVFHPIRSIDVAASKPHPPKTLYRVSYGYEHWGEGEAPVPVYKVQMVYEGVVTGRKSPSYPEGTKDLENVVRALADLRKGKGKTARGQTHPVGGENWDA